MHLLCFGLRRKANPKDNRAKEDHFASISRQTVLWSKPYKERKGPFKRGIQTQTGCAVSENSVEVGKSFKG